VVIDPSNIQGGSPTTQQVKSLGVSWLRYAFKCSNLTSLAPCFFIYDPFITTYTAAGINTLLVIDATALPGKPSGHNGSESVWNSYISAYVSRIGAIASHYTTQVAAYEVWAKEDSRAGTTDTYIPPKFYASLLSQSYKAIKSANSQAVVIMGGLTSTNTTYLKYVEKYSQNEISADAVGIQPYQERPYPSWPTSTWGVGTLWDDVWNYHNATTPMPLWITEMGTDDLSVQGDFPYNFFTSVNSVLPKDVTYAFWFCWSDSIASPYGLLSTSGSQKAAYISLSHYLSGA